MINRRPEGCRRLRGRALRLAALSLAVPLGQAVGQSPPRGTLRAELNGRSVDVRIARHRAYPAFNAIELARGLLSEGLVAGQSMRARLGGRDLVFEAGSPFFRLGESTYQLANVPYEWGGAFWIPSDFLTEWWPRAVGSVAGLAAGGPAEVSEIPVTPRPRRDPSRPMRVILDPGHGGKDPGTLSQGVREKNIVLGIGRALARALEARGGFEPILTRDTDVFIPIEERSRIAVRRQGELFVSIHVNSVPGRGSSARGFETYFLGLERSEEAREVALRENSVIQYENGGDAGITDDLQFILTGLDRNENIVESRRFAGCVQNSMRRAYASRRDRGVKQGKFWVLLGALSEMPSVIVEVGFVTNAAERRLMSSASGQQEIAAALAEAIAGYKAFLDTEAGASESGGGSC
jgi:N-acetylmuramoyl-L-alanine amidase